MAWSQIGIKFFESAESLLYRSSLGATINEARADFDIFSQGVGGLARGVGNFSPLTLLTGQSIWGEAPIFL